MSGRGMRERFIAQTAEAMERDPRLALVLADISSSAFREVAAAHPDRVVNVGIREQLMVSVAGGLALAGLRPIAHSYAPFLVERAFEQVKLDLTHQDVGAVLVSVGASYDWTEGGRTHQAPEDVALMATLPDWEIVVPGHADEAAAALRRAYAADGRTYVRLTERMNAEARPWNPAGLATVRRGSRFTAVAVGPTLDPVLQAVDGLDATVVYVTRVRPFDDAGLRAALTGPDLVVVEPFLAGTLGRELGSLLAQMPLRLLSLGVPRRELRRYGRPEEHDRVHGLDAPGIRSAVERFLELSG